MKGAYILLVLGLLVRAPLWADLSLVERSPFIWPGFNAGSSQAESSASPASVGDYEFHAVYEFSGATHVLLKDRRTSKFLWLLVGEERDGLQPKSYNPDSDRLLLASDSGETWLDLQELPEASPTPVASAPTTRPAITRSTSSSSRRAIVRPSTSSSRPSVVRRTPSVRTSTVGSRTVTNIAGPRSRSTATRRDIGLTPPTELPPEQDLSPPDSEAPSGGPPAPPSGGVPSPPGR